MQKVRSSFTHHGSRFYPRSSSKSNVSEYGFSPLRRFTSQMFYFRAAFLMMGTMLCTCWVVTLIFHPSLIEQNMVKKRIGYNNFCVGFDVQPSTTVGAVMFSIVVVLVVKMIESSQKICALLAKEGEISSRARTFSSVVNGCMFLSTMIIPLIFVVSPHEFEYAIWVHSIPFFSLMPVWGVFWSKEYFLTGIRSRVCDIYMVIFLSNCCIIPCLSVVDYIAFDRGKPIPVPPSVLSVLDHLWFAHFAIGNMVMKPKYEVATTFELFLKKQEGPPPQKLHRNVSGESSSTDSLTGVLRGIYRRELTWPSATSEASETNIHEASEETLLTSTKIGSPSYTTRSRSVPARRSRSLDSL